MAFNDRIARIHKLEDMMEYSFKTLRELYIPRIGSIVLLIGTTEESELAVDFSSRLATKFGSKVKILASRRIFGNEAKKKADIYTRKLKDKGIKEVEEIVTSELNLEAVRKLIREMPREEKGWVTKVESFDLIVFPMPLTEGVEPHYSFEEKELAYVELIRFIVRNYANPVLLVKKTPFDVMKIFGSIMLVIFDIDEMYHVVPISLAVADPDAEIMLSYSVDEAFLESMKKTVHELGGEVVEVECKLNSFAAEKVERRMEEIEPKIAKMKFKVSHTLTCGETISTLQSLTEDKGMGLLAVTGYGLSRLVEPDIIKIVQEINRPILLIPSSLMRKTTN
ncbi:MAG: hypothetical protein ACUVXA_04435 [Candidatus Jordarchaeum sp.]|uniref:hypothetical protein n=1 Tax=Candidatus Jordarchaeum sp. TaxID=2823881 RepID=UPI004049754D